MANHPHDKNRPESAAVMRAIENNDMEALKVALSPRMRAFCNEYVVDFNGAAAVIRAGYSPKWNDRQASTLLHHKGIATYIDHLTHSKEAKITAISPDYIIAQITSVIAKEGVRDGDKLRALELLMKHLGMFIERTEITGKDGEAIKIEQQTKQEADDFLNTIRRIADKEKKEVTLI